ncbi:MAG: SCO family protein [Candidatus Eisenbacteria bacterium]
MTHGRNPVPYLATLAVLVATLSTCSCVRRPGQDRASRVATPQGEPGVGPLGVTGASLFELDIPFTDRDGRTRHLSELHGTPFVASMMYTNCTSICPRVLADLQALEKALPERDRARTRFVLFSLDPQRDTPQALSRYGTDHALDPARWILLAAAPNDMRTIAAVLGVRFRPEEGGEIAHSAVIAVVDSGGIVRMLQTGLQTDMKPLLSAIARSYRPTPQPFTPPRKRSPGGHDPS